MKKQLLAIACSGVLAAACTLPAMAKTPHELVVPMELLNTETGNTSVGNIHIMMTEYGALFVPALQGVKPGVYGFHVHEKASCAPQEQDGKLVPALAAGGHWDPEKTGQHKGPWSKDGHKGDLPALAIDETNAYAVVAPRLTKLEELKGHALMIHQGGDNYSDSPAPLGGGGARMICGVIK